MHATRRKGPRPGTLAGWLSAAALAGLAACGGGEPGADGADGELSGRVSVDGSSTVYPVTQAMAEEFMRDRREVRLTVGISGTGGGFEKFCGGEIDIADASRRIKPSEEEACAAAGIEPVEVPVAWDGLSVVAHPANDWVECLTVDELRRIWQPESTIRRWNQIRSEFPDRELVLYGPDTDSGTFDYFTEAIVGEEDASRSDYTASADDNVLVRGVRGDEASLGYFGFAYYEANRDALKAVAVDGGSGCVAPTRETIESGAYQPLSREMYIYVARGALERPAVREFVRFYLENAPELVPESGYVPLDATRYRESLEALGLGAGSEEPPAGDRSGDRGGETGGAGGAAVP